MLIDLHVHSDNSPCSCMSVAEILAEARSMGLDGVCVTDHDSLAVLAQIEEGFQPDGLLLLVGMEYSTPQGDYLVYGDVRSLPSGMDAYGLFSAIKERDCAVVAAHPFRAWRPSDIACVTCENVAAIEVRNGRNSLRDDRLAEKHAAINGLPRVAGSDAHCIHELGCFPTRFTVPVTSSSDLVRALKNGQCEPGEAFPLAVGL
ncbi:PHP domain-containing protein [Pseudodesulfovibrio cashew]|uniref:PHP domain-containing protein n=1 Tax=Pseudodesulfovibrio cashew TaxID=2678688 RepID=A0A6I6JFT5_9BACT|nr:PHP domain-containing protein [Pseudodesulfovibrio cashew]QGY41695.1 PHP domain-containing protein [Pseudodesulfovibrio cashew]